MLKYYKGGLSVAVRLKWRDNAYPQQKQVLMPVFCWGIAALPVCPAGKVQTHLPLPWATLVLLEGDMSKPVVTVNLGRDRAFCQPAQSRAADRHKRT